MIALYITRTYASKLDGHWTPSCLCTRIAVGSWSFLNNRCTVLNDCSKYSFLNVLHIAFYPPCDHSYLTSSFFSLRRCLLFPMCLGRTRLESDHVSTLWTKAASVGIQQDEGWNVYSPGFLAAYKWCVPIGWNQDKHTLATWAHGEILVFPPLRYNFHWWIILLMLDTIGVVCCTIKISIKSRALDILFIHVSIIYYYYTHFTITNYYISQWWTSQVFVGAVAPRNRVPEDGRWPARLSLEN